MSSSKGLWISEAAFLVVLSFGPLAFGATEPWSRGVLQALIALVFLGCLREHGGGETAEPVRRYVLPVFVCFVILGCLQWANSGEAWGTSSLLPESYSSHRTAIQVQMWLSYALFVWSVPQILRRRGASFRAALTIFMLGVLVAVTGIIQKAQGNVAYYGLRRVRVGDPFGPYANYDHAASMMVMSTFIGCGILVRYVSRVFRPEFEMIRVEMAAKGILVAFLIGVVIIGIGLTTSRGAVLSMGLSAFIVIAFAACRARSNLVRGLIGLALFGAAAAAYAGLRAHPALLGFRAGVLDDSAATRLSLYRSGWLIAKDHPIFGVGLGAVKSVFPAYKEYAVRGTVVHVHNDWLEILIEMGAGALALYLAGLCAFNAYVLRELWSRPPLEKYGFLLACLAAEFAFLIHECVDFSFTTPANAVIFLTVLCLLSAFTQAQPMRKAFKPMEGWCGSKLQWAIVSLGLAFAATSLRPLIASGYFEAARSSPLHRIEFLRRGVSWDPQPARQFALVKANLDSSGPAGASSLLVERGALVTLDRLLRGDVLSYEFRSTTGELLRSLHRAADAAPLAGGSN